MGQELGQKSCKNRKNTSVLRHGLLDHFCGKAEKGGWGGWVVGGEKGWNCQKRAPFFGGGKGVVGTVNFLVLKIGTKIGDLE